MSDNNFTIYYWGGEEPRVVDKSTGHSEEEAKEIVNNFNPDNDKRAISASENDGPSHEYKYANGVFLSCGMMYGNTSIFKLPE